MSCSIQWFSCIIHETLDVVFVCDDGDPIPVKPQPLLVLIGVFENKLTYPLRYIEFIYMLSEFCEVLTYTFSPPILCIFLTHVLFCACLVFREIVLSYSTGHTTHWGCHSTIIVFSSFEFYVSRRHGFWEMTFSPLFCPLSGNVTLCKRGLRLVGSKPLAVTIGFPPFSYGIDFFLKSV